MKVYELWDTTTRNMIEAFKTEVAARKAAKKLSENNVGVYPASLALAEVDEEGETTWIAHAEGLL